MSDEESSGSVKAARQVDGTIAGSDPPSIDPAVLGMDHPFESVQHPRRRYLLYALAENPEWTLTELATKLAAWETETDEAEVDAEVRDEVYISLYHAHVPNLVELDVVSFDRETERITPGDRAPQPRAMLEGAGASLDAAQQRHAERPYESEEDGHEQE